MVVVDNGSTDKRRGGPDVGRPVPTPSGGSTAPRSPGPGAARNAGVRAAGGDLLAFCDADDMVQPGWLAACVAAARPTPTWSPASSTSGRSTAGRHSPLQPAATWQLGFLPAGLGANLAVRRRAFEQVGGFAEELLGRRGHRPVLAPPARRVPLRRSTPDAVVAKRDHPGFARSFPARDDATASAARALPPPPGRRRPTRSAGSGQIVALVDHPGAPGCSRATDVARPVGPRGRDAHREAAGLDPGTGLLPLTGADRAVS